MRVEPSSVQRQAVERLRAAIIAGEYAPGQRLVEAQLCEALGVSRPSVREALRSLEAEKLVLMQPNKGPQVAQITWPEAQSIYDVRSLLEGEAASRFVARATPAQLAVMRRALMAFDRAVARKNAAGRLKATDAFYQVLLEGCGNPIIQEVLQGLHARISFLRNRSMSLADRPAMSSQEMRAILTAIEAGDADATRAAAIAHVERACASAHAALLDATPLPPRATGAPAPVA